MTVHRVMGIETEYGISVPGDPTLNPMVASSQSSTPTRSRSCTAPAQRALGLRRGDAAARRPRLRPVPADADPSQLTDEDLGLANVILTNGARLYVDHAHPEYSTPEVTNPRDAVLWDKAGERIMARAMRAGRARSPARRRSTSTRTTPTTRARPTAAHENYLMRRATPFADIVRHLTPFFVTRQVVHRRRPRRHRAGRPRARRSSSASAPTSSRSRSGSRPRSSGRSSTRATSRTPTRSGTAGCTSSSATPT